jgi:hypothetical protein
LTSDFWLLTLPNILDTSSARRQASLCLLCSPQSPGAPALFSHKKIADLLDPYTGPRRVLLRGTPLPGHGLNNNVTKDLKRSTKWLILLCWRWEDNDGISDAPPSNTSGDDEEIWMIWNEKKCARCTLSPEGWESLASEDFLVQRRALMSQIIRRGFEVL